MDIQQDGTTYIKLYPSTGYGYPGQSRVETYASLRDPIPKHADTNNFFTVAALYSKRMNKQMKSDTGHYLHLGLNMFGSGGFSNAVGVSETGVAKFPRIAPGSDGFSAKDFYRDLITELRVCLHSPVKAHANVIRMPNIQWSVGRDVSGSGKFDFMWPVLEFEIADGTLSNLLSSNPDLSFSHKMNICLDVARAIDCLHDCGIVHSDIKSENVFIFAHPSRRYIAKVGDFGCSMILDGTEAFTGARVRLSGYTKLWCAPESNQEMNHKEIYRVDQYTFGMMVWQVITDGKTPFDWFSCDDARLSLDDISALKEADCMLPVALDTLGNLSLDEHEKNICSGIFNGTLGPNNTREDYLIPLIARHWLPSCWGIRDFNCQEQGVKQYVEPIPPMKVENILKDLTLDHRVPMQIFDSIKWYLSCAHDEKDEYRIASTSYQLFLCCYYGYGTERDMGACMSALAEAAKYGLSEAQALVAQFFDAQGMEAPEDLPICDWLEERTLDYTPGAGKTLKTIDPERYERIILRQRMSAETAVGLCSFSIEGIASLILERPHETRSFIEEIDTITVNGTGLRLVHMAAASGNLPVVEALLENGFCDFDTRDSYGRTPLHYACRSGHCEVALSLLSRHAIHDRGPFPEKYELIETCFNSLVSFGSTDVLEVVESLMRFPDPTDPQPVSDLAPLNRAIMDDNIEAVRILMRYGQKQTLFELMVASIYRCSEILHLFLNDITEKQGRLGIEFVRHLMHSAVNGDTLMSIKLHGFKHASAVISTVETIQHFIRIWYPHSDLQVERIKHEVLIDALYDRRMDTLQLVLDPYFKSSIPFSSKALDSVLAVPLSLGDTDMFSLLLENGAAEYNDEHFFTHDRYRGIKFRTIDKVFAIAIQSANPFFIRELIKKGIWLDSKRLQRATGHISLDDVPPFCAFQLAVFKECYDTATFLAKHTMQIEMEFWRWDRFFLSIIRQQVNLGYTMIDYLLNLKEGPKPLPSEDGSTILHSLATMYAVEPESRRSRLRSFMAGLVARFRDKIDIQTDTGITPLDVAISRHNILMVEALLEAGANPNALDMYGQTPLDRLLIGRSIQILRKDPKAPQPNPLPNRIEPIDLKIFGPVMPLGDVVDLESARSSESINGYSRDYQGDSYDKRLDKIYIMVRKPGGRSNLFPFPMKCTQRLENWTSMWVELGQLEAGQPIGEARLVIEQLERVWGPKLNLPHSDGRMSYIHINPYDKSIKIERF